tara:strand:+ start:4007 stop:4321 length:315 start_codon:yes stop_codon:yes gene_type:complete
MTEEQKEELVKMDWREVILKNMQDRRQRKKPPIKIAGGKPSIAPVGRTDELEFDSMFGEELDELAEMTREDLMDAVMDKIGQMSREELIQILESTQGNLMEATI